MRFSWKHVLLVVIVLAWLALDRYTKGLFAGMQPGESLGPILGGLVDLRLVHNTGGAWGIFAGNTLALGVFSIVVVGAILTFFFRAQSVNLLQTIGVALVAAGGIGNAIDRFMQGYVTDFLAVTFIDFPVFNVADIGVTCGVVLLLIGTFMELSKPVK